MYNQITKFCIILILKEVLKMKKCPNCLKEFKDSDNYCIYCGSKLVTKEYDEAPHEEFDIFGERITTKQATQDTQVNYEPNYDLNKVNFVGDPSTVNKANIWRLVALVSIGTLFIPIIGTVISSLSLAFNIGVYSKLKNNKAYIIVSAITLALSIAFIIALALVGLLNFHSPIEI